MRTRSRSIRRSSKHAEARNWVRGFFSLVLSFCLISLLAGCGANEGAVNSVSTPSTGGGPGTTLPGAIYVVVSGWPTDVKLSPDSVFVFPQNTTGVLDDEVAHWELAGSRIALDSAGNLFILRDTAIDVIPAKEPYLNRSRTLPIGPRTKIPAVTDMAVSPTGEIFITDGKGIAVFSATATGDADPVRYISGVSDSSGGPSIAFTPGLIALDAAENLYALNTADSSIIVFGPTANGVTIPTRTISDPLAGVTDVNARVRGMTTDSSGNLYLLCQCSLPGGNGSHFGVLEFSSTADGRPLPCDR